MPDPVEPGHGPMTEADLRAAWVVEPPKLTAKLQVVDYDPESPGLFRRERTGSGRCWGSGWCSSSASGRPRSGLAAKPIIDILLVVADPADEPAWLPDLEAAGYRLVIREPDWYQHRCLKGPDTNVNLHVYPPGCPEIERNLVFRDRLAATRRTGRTASGSSASWPT